MYKRILATVALALALATGGAATANAAASKPVPAADQRVAAQASAACAALTDDWTWEGCITGAVIRLSDRSTGSDYTDTPTGIRLTAPLHHIAASQGGSTVADRAALRQASAACSYILEGGTEHVARWLDCQVGTFLSIRGRAITDADVQVKAHDRGQDHTYTLALTHKSHRVVGLK